MFVNYYDGEQYPAAQPRHRPAPVHPPGPQSNIVCANCTTLLLYPQGAQNVRCARCSQITPVPRAGGSDSAQLVCNNQQCRTTLMYPRGASQVQCSLCGTINSSMTANQLGHIVCGCCRITLMYAFGAGSVKCAVCNTVTPVNQSTMTVLPAQHGPPSSGTEGESEAPKAHPTQTVVVANPPSLDEDGNEVEDIVVGVTSPSAQPSTNQSSKSSQHAPASLI